MEKFIPLFVVALALCYAGLIIFVVITVNSLNQYREEVSNLRTETYKKFGELDAYIRNFKEIFEKQKDDLLAHNRLFAKYVELDEELQQAFYKQIIHSTTFIQVLINLVEHEAKSPSPNFDEKTLFNLLEGAYGITNDITFVDNHTVQPRVKNIVEKVYFGEKIADPIFLLAIDKALKEPIHVDHSIEPLKNALEKWRSRQNKKST